MSAIERTWTLSRFSRFLTTLGPQYPYPMTPKFTTLFPFLYGVWFWQGPARRAHDRTENAFTAMSVRAFHDRRGGAHKNLPVQRERPALCIAKIEPDHFIELHAAAPHHLPQPGDTRLYLQKPSAMPGFISRQLIGDGRPRTDQGHLAAQNIDELGQCIQAG